MRVDVGRTCGGDRASAHLFMRFRRRTQRTQRSRWATRPWRQGPPHKGPPDHANHGGLLALRTPAQGPHPASPHHNPPLWFASPAHWKSTPDRFTVGANPPRPRADLATPQRRRHHRVGAALGRSDTAKISCGPLRCHRRTGGVGACLATGADGGRIGIDAFSQSSPSNLSRYVLPLLSSSGASWILHVS